MEWRHTPVLLRETLEALAVVPGGSYIDGTLGSAGHAYEVLKGAGAAGRLLGIDRDAAALERSRVRLAQLPGEHRLVHGAHGALRQIALKYGFDAVDGILLDLGVSSDQLDAAERGFSFRFDAPLDMRMDNSAGESAAQLLARVTEAELAELLWRLGEEPAGRRLARALKEAQEAGGLETTGQLAQVVSEALRRRGGARHPATRVFQALRMAVNRELEDLKEALEQGFTLLKPGGRLVVITFESLTDRLVKQCFTRHVGRRVSLQEGGARWEGREPRAAWVVKRALTAGEAERLQNPRARSAKLRAIRTVAQ